MNTLRCPTDYKHAQEGSAMQARALKDMQEKYVANSIHSYYR